MILCLWVYAIYLNKIIFIINLRNKSPFYILFTPIMIQFPIYIYFHLILSIRLYIKPYILSYFKATNTIFNFATLNNFSYNIL